MKKIPKLYVNQDTIYKEIPKLIKLRDKLVKESGNKSIYVYFSKITNWGTFTDKEYEKKAVWKESHSNYSDLVRILNENVKKSYWQDRFMGTNMTDLLED